MSIQDFYEDVERSGGSWVSIFKKGEKFGGELVAIEVLDRRDPDGNVVLGKKSGKPRKIYRVIVRIPDDQREGPEDDGIRKWDANESGQTAIREAYKKAGTKELIGGRFQAVVTEDAPTAFDQATYKAKFEPPAKTVDLPDDPFSDDAPF